MLKSAIMFLAFLAMINCSISQEGYPRKIVIDRDTVCAITFPQVDSVNKTFVDLDECNELKDSLYSQINTYGKLVEGQKQIIISQGKEIDIQKNIVIEKDNIIASDEKLLKKQNRQVQWLKIQRAILSVAVLTLGVTVIVLNR